MKAKARLYIFTALFVLSNFTYASKPKVFGTKSNPAEGLAESGEPKGYVPAQQVQAAPPGGPALMHEAEEDIKGAAADVKNVKIEAAAKKKQEKKHRPSKSDSHDINFRPRSRLAHEIGYNPEFDVSTSAFPKGSEFRSTGTDVERYGSDFLPTGTDVERHGPDFYSSATAVIHAGSDFYTSATAVPRSGRYGNR